MVTRTDISRRIKEREAQFTPQEIEMRDRISKCLFVELALELLEGRDISQTPHVIEASVRLNLELQELKKQLESWLASADNFLIVTAYSTALYDEITESGVGADFAMFLCSLITPQRVLEISVDLKGEADILTTVASGEIGRTSG